MAYERKEVIDGVTVMDKELYDNLQDGIDEAKERINAMTSVVQATIESTEE